MTSNLAPEERLREREDRCFDTDGEGVGVEPSKTTAKKCESLLFCFIFSPDSVFGRFSKNILRGNKLFLNSFRSQC